LCFREIFLPEAGHSPVVADGTVAVTEIGRHLNLQVRPLIRVIWVEIKNAPADRCATQSWNCFDDHQKTGSRRPLVDRSAVITSVDGGKHRSVRPRDA
jgi:hypothetical protein